MRVVEFQAAVTDRNAEVLRPVHGVTGIVGVTQVASRAEDGREGGLAVLDVGVERRGGEHADGLEVVFDAQAVVIRFLRLEVRIVRGEGLAGFVDAGDAGDQIGDIRTGNGAVIAKAQPQVLVEIVGGIQVVHVVAVV